MNSAFYVCVLILVSLLRTPPPRHAWRCLNLTFHLLSILFLDAFAALWYRVCIPFRVFLISQQIYTEISFSWVVLAMYLTILGAFTNLRKATVSVVISALPPVRMEQLGCHWTDFHEIWYLSTIRKMVEKIQVSLKSEKNNGYFTWRQIYVFDHISHSCS